MRYLILVSLISSFFLGNVFADVSTDSTTKARFQRLADKLRIKEPESAEGDYQIRIWKKCGLCFGDAQMAYILHKTKKRFSVLKYIINLNQQGFQFSKRLKPTVPIKPVFWERLLKRNILTLPNQSVVLERLYAMPEPRRVDTVQAGMQVDGSFTVKGHKTPRGRTLVSDGEGYSVELFSTSGYRIYSYSNPDVYLGDNPQSEELQNIVGILSDLKLVFQSGKSEREQAKAINKD